MCLAVPVRVVQRLGGDEAIVDAGGIRKQVSLALVPEASPGDYVIVHVGYAISRLDADEALRTLALFAGVEPVAGAGRSAGAGPGE
jgi:hydrogenase expression/formation protein HypC